MPNIEAITILAVIEAQDKASSLLEGIFGSLSKTAASFKAMGDAAELSGRMVDAGLLTGATAADRLSIADDRLTTAQELSWEATQKLRAAQVELGVAIETNGAKSAEAAAAQAALREAQLANTTATGLLADATKAQAVAQAEVDTKSTALKNSLSAAAGAMVAVGGATALAAGYSVKMAGDFQQQTQTLVSGAGVQQNQIDGVRAKLLQMSVDTGTSTKDLSDAFFQVKSRMDDVSQAETVMSDAAEIAKVHNADLNTVSIALASSLNAYAGTGLTAGQAANILGVAVEKGGMSFQDLAGSLSTVLPKAKEAGLSFAQVTAAVATMTQSGQSSQQATQDLAHAIGKLQGPTSQMISTWNQIGLTQKQVSDALHGPGGLEAAMNLIADTARSKVGPSGQIVVDTFKQSQDASSALGKMLQSMTPDAAKLAQALQNGSISVKDYNKAALELTGTSSDQAKQFESLYNKANGFNDAVKAGQPGFSDFSALMKSAYGDTTSMQAALLLGGQAASKWSDTTNAAAAAAKNAGSGIQGWDAVQGTLNQKMDQAKAAFSAAAISLGTALLPAVTDLIKAITPWLTGLTNLIQKHQEAVKILVTLGLAIGAVGVAIKMVVGFIGLFKDAKMIFNGLKEAWAGVTAVMEANPIILVITAIALLVVGVIYAFNHFKAFHNFVMGSWAVIKGAGVDLWHMLETAFKGISTAAQDVWNFLVGAFNGVVNAVTGFGTAVWKDITDVWNGISDFFKKWWPLLLVIFAPPIAAIIAIWNHFHTQITDAAKVAWDLIKNYIINPVKEAFDWTKGALGDVGSAFVTAWNWLSGVAQKAWNGIRDNIINPLQGAWNWIMGFVGGVSDFFTKGFNDILNWLGGVGSWFESVGENIVNGIISGLDHAGSWLMNKIGNMANDALKAAKSFLGISSPSKAFADEVGQWIPHGVASGIEDNTHVAVGAVQKMAGALPSAIGVTGAASIGATLAGTAGLGVPSTATGAGQFFVTIDLTNAVVAGDRGMQDLVNQIGNAFVTRVLPQAGVRFHS